jgi:competence protein ComEC
VRRAAVLHWPALLAGSACAGLALANAIPAGAEAALAGLAVAALALLVLEGPRRTAALALALAAAGLWWGSLRLDALSASVLAAEVGTSGDAELVTTGPARRTSWAARIPAEVRAFRGRRLRERVLLVIPVGRSPPPRGAVLEAHARVTEPRSPAGRGGFDEHAWLARQGVHVVLRATTWRQVGARGGLPGVGDRLRDRVEEAAGLGTDGSRRAVVLGVVLGEDEGLSAPLQERFQASGLYHLLAVSGQNVAFLAGGVMGLCWLMRVPRVARELVTVLAIGAYVLAVGWQPSVVRAGVAGALASLAWLAGRPRDRWHFLALGALVLLAWTPASLLEPGFQLSFAAVAAIFLCLSPVERALGGRGIPRVLADALGVALVCGLATAPIVLAHFGQAPVYTVPANAVAFPAAPLVLGFGLLAAAASPFSPAAAGALAWLAGLAAAWLEVVARLFASLPGAQITAGEALVGALLLSAGLLAARVLSARLGAGATRAAATVAAGLALLAGAGWWSLRPAPAWTPPGGLRVSVLDVGQGDAILLETASARVLVDQGPPEADVAGQLARLGISSLSALVLTHPQRDHVGGAADVLRRLRVGTVLDPGLAATGPEREEAVAAARARGVPVRVVRAGAELRAGGLALRVLWPPDAGRPFEDPNLNALVLLASFGEVDVLLPADAESDVTGRLPLPPVEVLKVAHHGSADPGLDEELAELRPRVAVVSAGRGNEYGHPRPETLAALAAVPGLAVYRTDVDGRVVIDSDGRGLRVRTEG